MDDPTIGALPNTSATEWWDGGLIHCLEGDHDLLPSVSPENVHGHLIADLVMFQDIHEFVNGGDRLAAHSNNDVSKFDPSRRRFSRTFEAGAFRSPSEGDFADDQSLDAPASRHGIRDK